MARRRWDLPWRDVTPESAFLNRRDFLRGSAAIGAGLALGVSGNASADEPAFPEGPAGDRYPGKKNEKYTLDRPETTRACASKHNNFYEFDPRTKAIWPLAEKLTTDPWTLECTGLAAQPKTWDLGDLIRAFDLEERTYRFRCVEAWSMAIPWTGFPLKALIDKLEPQANAKFVKFTSFDRPKEAPGQKDRDWPWPYYEGLSMEEATNELTMVVTGAYGKPLAKSQGAPIRIIVPWKYGYKSAKSIVKLELVQNKPRTFWNDLAPQEYGFESNVDPAVPHPRWSQEEERFMPAEGKVEKRKTLKYNGYEEFVAGLYKR